MDILIFKVAIRMAIGFAIGAATLLFLIHLNPAAFGHGPSLNAIGLCLQLWGFGIPFAVGFLFTSMAFEKNGRHLHRLNAGPRAARGPHPRPLRERRSQDAS